MKWYWRLFLFFNRNHLWHKDWRHCIICNKREQRLSLKQVALNEPDMDRHFDYKDHEKRRNDELR